MNLTTKINSNYTNLNNVLMLSFSRGFLKSKDCKY